MAEAAAPTTLWRIIMEDIASLEEWFYNNDIFIIPYIEKNFNPISFEHQYNLMLNHLIFAKTII